MIETHPVSDIFPMMQPDEFGELVNDIQTNGLHQPVIIHDDGRILDGRNRYKACLEAGVEPDFETWHGDGSLVEYVLSLNLHRRHLNAGQKAGVALNILPHLEDEAKERQLASLKQNQTVVAKLPPRNQGKSRDIAAEKTGASPRYVTDVKKIKEEEPAKFDEIMAGTKTIQEVKREISPHVANNSGNNEWYTPAEYIDAATEVMGNIDLDPASCNKANEVVAASQIFTKDDDGLSKEWRERVWMNPPYAQPLIAQFVDKMNSEVESGRVAQAIVLVNNATDTKWFHSLCLHASMICFTSGRVKFYKDNGEIGAPLQGQAIVYIGDNQELFFRAFSGLGLVVQVAR